MLRKEINNVPAKDKGPWNFSILGIDSMIHKYRCMENQTSYQ